MSTFVGRAEELRVLGELFARSGDGVVAAIVMGDPGSGKTRLLAEAIDRFVPDDTARIVGYEPQQTCRSPPAPNYPQGEDYACSSSGASALVKMQVSRRRIHSPSIARIPIRSAIDRWRSRSGPPYGQAGRCHVEASA